MFLLPQGLLGGEHIEALNQLTALSAALSRGHTASQSFSPAPDFAPEIAASPAPPSITPALPEEGNTIPGGETPTAAAAAGNGGRGRGRGRGRVRGRGRNMGSPGAAGAAGTARAWWGRPGHPVDLFKLRMQTYGQSFNTVISRPGSCGSLKERCVWGVWMWGKCSVSMED